MITEQTCPECGGADLTLADAGINTFVCRSCAYVGPATSGAKELDLDDEEGLSLDDVSDLNDDGDESPNLLKANKASLKLTRKTKSSRAKIGKKTGRKR